MLDRDERGPQHPTARAGPARSRGGVYGAEPSNPVPKGRGSVSLILQPNVLERLGVLEVVTVALGRASGLLGPLLDHWRGVPVAHLALVCQQPRHLLIK